MLSQLTEAVPEGPALLVTLDVTALGTSAARLLLQSGGDSLLGLRELCGFEPLLALRQVALAVPPSAGQATPDFALIAQTTLESEPALRCAEAVIRKRGGDPARSRLGAFESVRDRKKPLGEVALRADGLFVLSGGEYFRAVVDAASGARSNDDAARLRSAVHAKVRGNLGRHQIVLSALPSDALALPGVQALGIGLDIGREVDLRGALYCASVDACRAAQAWLAGVLGDAAKRPELAWVAGVRSVQRGAELDVSGRLSSEQLRALVSQLLAPRVGLLAVFLRAEQARESVRRRAETRHTLEVMHQEAAVVGDGQVLHLEGADAVARCEGGVFDALHG